MTLSINISPRQFTDSWLAQKIVRLLTETGFPAERLVVEITESSLFADIDLARTIVTSLKNQGIALALDDFGTRLLVAVALAPLPFDKIKIDRSFVASIQGPRERGDRARGDDDGAGARCARGVEGIEDAAAHEALLEMGCASGRDGISASRSRPRRSRNCCAQRATPRGAAAAPRRRLSAASRLTSAAVPPRDGGIARADARVVSMVKTALSIAMSMRAAPSSLPAPRRFGRARAARAGARRASAGTRAWPTICACSR